MGCKKADIQPGQVYERDGRRREVVGFHSVASRRHPSPVVVWRKPGDLWRSRACSVEAWKRWAKGASPVALGELGLDPRLAKDVEELGYAAVCVKDRRGLCGVRQFLYTGALVFGIGPLQYEGRYCYSTLAEALEALQAWTGEGDPPGQWIMLKATTGERAGPGCS